MARSRSTALVVAAAFSVATFSACGRGASPPPPPVDDTQRGAPQPGGPQPSSGGAYRDVQGRRYDVPRPPQTFAGEPRTGMSSTQKMVILGGAAALYYMYRKHQHAAAEVGPDGQYYLSKNGRVYYRDADHRAHWVTPPPDGIAVPADEAGQYAQFQGYQNRSTGRGLSDLGAGETGESN
ncbi:MAG TPA: hypothetical protein VMT03_21795 [Polyangia bacterium]|nr:hypothetical protein [Polyangia bacterium]